MSDASGTKQSTLRTALAGLIGNVLEWFDFAVYGYFASNIGHQFFPKSDPAVQTFLDVRDVRARLLRAAGRQHRARPRGRSHRTKAHC